LARLSIAFAGDNAMNTLQQWEYALACVLVPMAWGLLMVWAGNTIEAWIARRAADPAEHVGPDYRI
jgi:hypothetical protein